MGRRRRHAAIVGLGAAGGFAARAMDRLDGIDCVAGVDPLGSAASGYEGEFPVLHSVRELARQGEIDIAIVAVPTPLHEQACNELLEYEVAAEIWCEKPLAVRLADADALTRSATSADTELRVLLHTAFAPEVLWTHRELPELIDRHGPLITAASRFHDAYFEQFASRLASLANCWLDSGINALSVLARFVKLGAVIDAEGQLPVRGQTRVGFRHQDHDGIASIFTSWDTESSCKTTEITFEDGYSLVLNHSEATATTIDTVANRRNVRRFDRKPLEERYQPMLEAYLTRSRLMFDNEQVSIMHRCLFDAQAQMGTYDRE